LIAGAVIVPSGIFCPATMKICAPGLRSSKLPGTNRTTGVPGGTMIFFSPIAFVFNAPRLIACIGPLIAGTLIVGLGGYGPAATIIGSLFIVGFLVAPFLPETNGRPLPGAF
jgi:hypothetical protein